VLPPERLKRTTRACPDLLVPPARMGGVRLKSRSGLLALLSLLALSAAGAATAGSGGEAGPGDAARSYASPRYGYSLAVPSGWHRSQARLVDTLLMPREVVSVGTFGMAVGGGGNCGREPAASIERMRPGDALVTVQEYAVTAGMRSRLRRTYPPRPRIDRLQRSARAYAGGSAAAPGGAPLYFATIPFRDHGRVFDALVYFRGRPGAERRARVNGILSSLSFAPDPAGFGAHA